MNINTNNGYKGSSPSTNNQDTAALDTKTKNTANAAKAQMAEPKNIADKVVISPQAKAFGKLADNVAKTPDFDSEKVASIKKAIAEGSFEVDAERIAEKMLQQDALF